MSKPASGYIHKILNPLIAKRAGVSFALIDAWTQIVGEDIASMSMPLKVKWPRRASEDDVFEPGTLMIAAEGMAALHIQHQTGQIIEKVNAFLGYRAIGRVQLTQRPVDKKKPKKRQRPITSSEKRKVERLAGDIEDDGLRDALTRFGQSVIRDKK